MYKAPAKIISEKLNIILYDDWGFDNHSNIQDQILCYGPVLNGYDLSLVKTITTKFSNSEKYTGIMI